MRAVFSDAALIAAMLKAEAALAEAEAEAGLVPKAARRGDRQDQGGGPRPCRARRETADAGVPAIPFVKAVEAKLPAALRRHFHNGATSQDIVDTALALQMARGVRPDRGRPRRDDRRPRALAKAHRRTPMRRADLRPARRADHLRLRRGGLARRGSPTRRRSLPAVAQAGAGRHARRAGRHARRPRRRRGRRSRRRTRRTLGLVRRLPARTRRAGGSAAAGAWLATLIGALAKMATDVVFLRRPRSAKWPRPLRPAAAARPPCRTSEPGFGDRDPRRPHGRAGPRRDAARRDGRRQPAPGGRLAGGVARAARALRPRLRGAPRRRGSPRGWSSIRTGCAPTST